MTVIVVERVTPGLRGQLTRWMLELRAGVFVGTVSARVREILWHGVCASRRRGACLMVHSTANEQGFAIRSDGDATRIAVDLDGLTLLRRASGSTATETQS